MAKQTEDTKTLELLPMPKKRGRPCSDKSLSAKQRKEQQRERDKSLLWGSTDFGISIPKMTTEGLADAARLCTKRGHIEMLDMLCSEMKYRAEAARSADKLKELA